MDVDHVALTSGTIDAQALIARVAGPAAGAIVTFMGTTRDTFNGRTVVRLEFEAYEPMAVKMLRRICAEAREKWSLTALAVEHRLGLVPVGESSVVIAAASVHRIDAIEGMHYIIDELKSRAPIFKREVYTDGSEWKANCAGCTIPRSEPHSH